MSSYCAIRNDVQLERKRGSCTLLIHEKCEMYHICVIVFRFIRFASDLTTELWVNGVIVRSLSNMIVSHGESPDHFFTM